MVKVAYVQGVVKDKPEPIDNTALVEAFRAKGGRLLHIPADKALNGRKRRGLTAAFIIKSGRIEIATGVQHRSDDFTKKVGTKTAIEHFNAGKTIHLPLRGKTVNFDDLASALTWLR
jgi:hypothetical protein